VTLDAAADDWLDAFPLAQAERAVNAICVSWDVLRTRPAKFNAKMKEPQLTKLLKAHVEKVSARAAGLRGVWVAENVLQKFDPETFAVSEERRTDIMYGWNDDAADVTLQLVFEFKKLSKKAAARNQYVGDKGLMRFVTGIYSEGQPAAAMVGVLTDSADQVVPPLSTLLSSALVSKRLRMAKGSCGNWCQSPSKLFTAALFDTTHNRPPELAPSHGSIQVAHIFLAFS
jgi:hypothetical protein